ncbi:EcsC family protein [Streptomyces zagrosensis]|nr:EcsC family protein [Streptomyces zagrosensis]
MASLAAVVSRGAKTAGTGVQWTGRGVRAGLTAVADRIIAGAPRIPIRDLATLRAQFPGHGPEEIADKLVAGAAGGTSTVGAGVGAAAMLPVPPAMPAELAAEIVGVASIEFKLIAELHEVYGLRAPGTLRQRTTAYLTAWTQERGIDVVKPASLNAALSGPVKRELRQRIVKRTFRNLPNLAPFMIGAVVGAMMNRRDTKKLADKIRKDLRARQVPWDQLPAPEPVVGELPPATEATGPAGELPPATGRLTDVPDDTLDDVPDDLHDGPHDLPGVSHDVPPRSRRRRLRRRR